MEGIEGTGMSLGLYQEDTQIDFLSAGIHADEINAGRMGGGGNGGSRRTGLEIFPS